MLLFNRSVQMQYNKVEISGVNTNELKTLKESGKAGAFEKSPFR